MRLRLVLPLVVGVGAAFLGPRLTLPTDRAAGQPFEYEPPQGFAETKVDGQENAKAWVLLGGQSRSFVPRVNVTHTPKRGGVETRELGLLASTLPETFAADFQWTERRHETRVRADGTRVGLIEGECVKKLVPDAVGIPLEQKFRMLQLVFPDDTGTTIATATYGVDEASKWEPVFEATITTAKGVALRAPPSPGWVHAAWGAAGVILGWLGAALVGRAPEETKAPKQAKETKDANEADDATSRGRGRGTGHPGSNGVNGSARRGRDEEEDADEDEDDDSGGDDPDDAPAPSGGRKPK